MRNQASRPQITGIFHLGSAVASAIVGMMVTGMVAAIFYDPDGFIFPVLVIFTDFPLETVVILGASMIVFAMCLMLFMGVFSSMLPHVLLHILSGGIAGGALWVALSAWLDRPYMRDELIVQNVRFDENLLYCCFAGLVMGLVYRVLLPVLSSARAGDVPDEKKKKLAMRLRVVSDPSKAAAAWTGDSQTVRARKRW